MSRSTSPSCVALRARGAAGHDATGLWLAERGGARTVGVTGTKGKSTTATLIAHLLAASGARSSSRATSAARRSTSSTPADGWVVIELSSFQIADLAVGPEIAVVLNLYREHLDWHLSEEAYRAEKLRILALPGVRRRRASPATRRILAAPRAARAASHPVRNPRGWHVSDDGLLASDGELSCPPRTCRCRGRAQRAQPVRAR